MCLSFFFLNPAPVPGSYRLILAMNRDEVLARKTSPASWKEGILCGRDETAGKEGGTWLGVDEEGNVGILTNIYTGKPEVGGKGRGTLITDFLKGKEKNAEKYLQAIAADKDAYNPFNLYLLYAGEKDGIYRGRYYCRGKEGHAVKTTGPLQLESGCHGAGNHPYPAPFEKTKAGLVSFEDIVERLGSVAKEQDLVRELTELMGKTEKHFPDKQMALQGSGVLPEIMQNLSSNFVELEGYGTRTHTFILVDYDFGAKMLERNRPAAGGQEWIKNDHSFQIKRKAS